MRNLMRVWRREKQKEEKEKRERKTKKRRTMVPNVNIDLS